MAGRDLSAFLSAFGMMAEIRRRKSPPFRHGIEQRFAAISQKSYH
jgi:hypothetical protein